MIYDEGFDIVAKDQSYFAFSMYTPRGSTAKKWDSHCYATLNGWYREGDNWGCFYAYKNKVKNPFMVTNDEAKDKQIVLEGVVKKVEGKKVEGTETEKVLSEFIINSLENRRK